jgi:hypothetical protein
VLTSSGVLCLAIVHPINSAGKFEGDAPDARFIIERSYLEPRNYQDSLERDGLRMTFNSRHWPLQDYIEGIGKAGLVVETLRELPVDEASVRDRPSRARWRRLPLFLDLRARKR